MPDAYHEAGAAAAAAAGGSAGGGGERQRPRTLGQVHQCHPGPHGRAAGIRLHVGQLHHPFDEDEGACGGDSTVSALTLLSVETLGLSGGVDSAQLSSWTPFNATFQTFREERTHGWNLTESTDARMRLIDTPRETG